MKVLIDGDILVYRCGFAAENRGYIITGHEDAGWFNTKAAVTEWLDANIGEGVTREVTPVSEAEPVENALHNVDSVIEAIIVSVDSADIRVCLSGDSNFRYSIATERPYKGNRADTPRPIHYNAILEHIKRKYPFTVSEEQEADDDMGIAQTALTAKYTDPDKSCIVSIDKDMDMIPGNHFNFVKNDAYFITPEDSWYYFYTQLIVGDSTDNIPGLPGKGPKAAKKALENTQTPEEMYQAVRTLYVQSLTDRYADEALLEQARLLWIRREEGELWNPPC